MKFKLSISGLAGNLRQLGAILGIILSTSNYPALPTSVRGVLLAISGIVLTAEHVVDGLKTSPTAPTPVVTPIAQA